MRSKNQFSVGMRLFTKVFKDELVAAAYQGILGRPPDTDGGIVHGEALYKTANLAETLRTLSHSDELAIQLPYEKILEQRRSAHLDYLQSLPHVATSAVKILVMGNCQARALARLIDAMLGIDKTSAIELLPDVMKGLEEGDPVLSQLIGESDFIFLHPHGEALGIIKKNYPEAFGKLRMVPRISYSAFFQAKNAIDD